jgi:hypothetical protein
MASSISLDDFKALCGKMGKVDDDDDEEEEEEEEEEAGPSNKKLKKGGQQKIDFPKVAKAATTHPASTGIMGPPWHLIMGLKSVGAKRM